jgi:hypothetical protein
MPRRPPQTLADYVVVAIAPTLIVLVVGALLFFLIELFYPEAWHARLRWIFGWYAIAVVGISRISLEQGWAYASMFAAALSVAVALVVPPMSWPLLAVVWWAAHKLTRDTTLIDETQDASGQGLWETAVTGAPPPPVTPEVVPDDAASHKRRQPPAAVLFSLVRQWLSGEEPPRPHTPGRWVIYFCLAAVPLFGLGGWLLPPDPARRAWAMQLLVVYTACGLGLLLSTSFLGLRRYLRQRQVIMPPEMTAIWLAAGSLTIVATLLIAAVLPRPRPEVSVLRLGQLVALNVRQASPWGWGREGLTDDTTPEAATTPGSPEETSREVGGRPSDEDGASGQRGQEASPASQTQGRSGSATQSPTQGTSHASEHSQETGEGSHKTRPSPTDDANQPGNRSRETGNSQRERPGRGGERSSQFATGRNSTSRSTARQANRETARQTDAARPQDSHNALNGKTGQSEKSAQDGESGSDARKPADGSEAVSTSSQRRWAELPGALVRGVGQVVAALLRVAATVAGLCLIAFVLWTYRAELAEAWRKLLEDLAALWGSRRLAPTTSPPPATMAARPPRPFATYADPFATGSAGRMPWPELVRYTFSALEAWAREHGCPRPADQTPQEFVARLRSRQDLPGEPLALLAAWYSELAYAPQQMHRARPLVPLKRLWEALRASCRGI